MNITERAKEWMDNEVDSGWLYDFLDRESAEHCVDASGIIRDLLAEVDKWKNSLESLTPGGSEFVNDPDACAAYLRDRLNYPRRIVHLMTENTRLNALIHAASQRTAEDFKLYVAEARKHAAMECVEIMVATDQEFYEWDVTWEECLKRIKAHFGLEG